MVLSSEPSEAPREANRNRILAKLVASPCKFLPGILTVVAGGIGAAVGFLLRDRDIPSRYIMYLEFPGRLFQNGLLLLVAPCMSACVALSACQLGPRMLLRVLSYSAGYALLSMALTQAMAVGLVHLLRPGEQVRALLGTRILYANATEQHYIPDAVIDFARSLFPGSVMDAFMFEWETGSYASEARYEGFTDEKPLTMKSMLDSNASLGFNGFAIVTFSMLFGVVLAERHPGDTILVDVVEGVTDVLLCCARAISRFSPVGVGLLALGWVLRLPDVSSVMEDAGAYVTAVGLGCILHSFLVLPLLCAIFLGAHGINFLRVTLQPLSVAAGTASSMAALPPMIVALENEGSVDPRLIRVLLPVLTLMRKDMVVFYCTAFALSMAQAADTSMTILDWLYFSVITMVTSLMILGTPGESMVTIDTILLNSVGLSYAQPLLRVLRLMDPALTAVHVLGHSIGIAVVQSLLSQDMEKASHLSIGTVSTQP